MEKFDVMRMYYADPYVVNDKITIYMPTVGQIMRFGKNNEYGETEFYQTLNIFVSNPTTHRLQLWEMGIDWNKITEFDLFLRLISSANPEALKIIFGDFDFSSLCLSKQTLGETEQIVLYDPVRDIVIDENIYTQISHYLRTVFNIFPKKEKVKGKAAKQEVINEEKRKLAADIRTGKDKESTSVLFPLVSSCLMHPGFKYTKDQLQDMGIFEFMYNVQRLQIYESSTALLKGAYSGFIDATKIDQNEMNFMRSIELKF